MDVEYYKTNNHMVPPTSTYFLSLCYKNVKDVIFLNGHLHDLTNHSLANKFLQYSNNASQNLTE